MEALAYTPVEFNYLETLAKTSIIPAGQKQFFQENIFNNAPVRRNAITKNENSALTGSNTKNSNLVSTIWSQTNYITQKNAVDRILWFCRYFLLWCYHKENPKFSR